MLLLPTQISTDSSEEFCQRAAVLPNREENDRRNPICEGRGVSRAGAQKDGSTLTEHPYKIDKNPRREALLGEDVSRAEQRERNLGRVRESATLANGRDAN